MKKVIMVLDIGTSVVKCCAYNTDFQMIASASKDAITEIPAPNAFIQYGDDFVRLAKAVLKEVAVSVSEYEIAAIGMTGQMAGAMGVDENFNAVTEWSGTIDGRQAGYQSAAAEAFGDEILKDSGTNTPFMGPKIQYWRDRTPEAYARAKKFVIIGCYVAAKLCGLGIEDAYTDPTYLAWTGLGDLKNFSWSRNLCDRYGISMELLPKVVPCDSVIGHITETVAVECGIRAGIPVVAGAGDKPAGCLGAGVIEEGMITDEASTVGALSFCTNSYIPDLKNKTLEILCSTLPGQYYALSYISGSGVAINWFNDAMAPSYGEAAKLMGISKFDMLDARAEKIPAGSEGLFSVSLLGGRALPITPDVNGTFIGHTWSHTIPHFYRAFLEGMSYEYNNFFRIMKETYPDIPTQDVHVIGGGSRSALYNRIKADVLGIDYTPVKLADCALLGVALLTAYAAGLIGDIKAKAKELAVCRQTIRYDEETHAQYERLFEKYLQLMEGLKPIYRELKE